MMKHMCNYKTEVTSFSTQEKKLWKQKSNASRENKLPTKTKFVQMPISHSTLRVHWIKSRFKPTCFFAPFTYSSVIENTTLIWHLIQKLKKL